MKYIVTVADETTGRDARLEATGNTCQIAVRAALLNCFLPRAAGGQGMVRPKLTSCKIGA
ncbi:MAG: hypothetical protein V3S55_15170 [Nitrospiraceae bacterium]